MIDWLYSRDERAYRSSSPSDLLDWNQHLEQASLIQESMLLHGVRTYHSEAGRKERQRTSILDKENIPPAKRGFIPADDEALLLLPFTLDPAEEFRLDLTLT